MAGEQGISPGWYDDGATAAVVRWFDGSRWTEHTRPAPTMPVAPAPSHAFQPVPATTQTFLPGPASSPVHRPEERRSPASSPVQSAFPTFGEAPGSPLGAAFGGGTFGSPAQGYGSPAFGGFGAGAGSGPWSRGLANQAEAAKVRRRVTQELWLGIGSLLLGIVVAAWLTSAGAPTIVRYLPRAAAFAGFFMLRSCRKSYKQMVELGGRPWSSGQIALAVVAGSTAVLVYVSTIIAVVVAGTGSARLGPEGAGSCWRETAKVATHVSCDKPHDYVGVQVVTDKSQCPAEARAVMPRDDGTGTLLCMAPDPEPVS
ncbi:DUF2510 domain-containing protein [Cellulomonas sp. URHD0024]|uniref:DUF2510 domain-containing protein n=1 Tax=Cellulomonas sp. URHD0024 TaxID=1302620 RepID=UPI0004092E3A|nr:DUF2510 domain-containing protein [Cellulomonas sp. URHD0024]